MSTRVPIPKVPVAPVYGTIVVPPRIISDRLVYTVVALVVACEVLIVRAVECIVRAVECIVVRLVDAEISSSLSIILQSILSSSMSLLLRYRSFLKPFSKNFLNSSAVSVGLKFPKIVRRSK
ncbi:hypothetical protein JTB14_013866 [Gonioctena quinquepunctata]|nr:hypothetical protein JTB14_013866 [Gonioctena quinquepunctata]